jgi:hypothetical protein
VLVVGGSLGAKALNDVVPKALALMPPEQRPLVRHQSGERQIEALRAAYAEAGVEAELTPFIHDTAEAFADADLVVCRAGAMHGDRDFWRPPARRQRARAVSRTRSTTTRPANAADSSPSARAAVLLPQQDQLSPERLAAPAAAKPVARAELLDARNTKARRPCGSGRHGRGRGRRACEAVARTMKHKVIRHIHFVGIGGSGMSGIAEVLLNLGYVISGFRPVADSSHPATPRRAGRAGPVLGHAAGQRGRRRLRSSRPPLSGPTTRR